jgi:hypothetical protein
MPSDDGFGPDDHESRSPFVPELREPGPQEPVRDTELQFAGMLGALKHQELVPEGKDLRVERSSGAESLPQRTEQ